MLLDTSAWIEFFKGTPSGEKVKELLDTHQIYTSVLTIAEIVRWSIANELGYLLYVNTIEQNSTVLPVDNVIATIAGKTSFEQRKRAQSFGMIDSLIYTTAQTNCLTLMTKDRDFLGLAQVEII